MCNFCFVDCIWDKSGGIGNFFNDSNKERNRYSRWKFVGSNPFNILAVLGSTSIFNAIQVNPEFVSWDIQWTLAVSILLMLFLYSSEKENQAELKVWWLYYFIALT